MAPLIHLDTHVLVWLYVPAPERLSEPARERIESGRLAASPMAVLELTFLHEIGRLRVDGPTILASLRDDLGVEVDATPFGEVVAAAHGFTWTRDPFDRLIAAQAMVAGATLVTKDEALRTRMRTALW